jgi:antitoxin VapB
MICTLPAMPAEDSDTFNHTLPDHAPSFMEQGYREPGKGIARPTPSWQIAFHAIYYEYIAFAGGTMSIGSVFENNRTQAVRLPADTRFPKTVKKVSVRVVGNMRIIEPANNTWNSFFHPGIEGVTDDFMTERASQEQPDREPFSC